LATVALTSIDYPSPACRRSTVTREEAPGQLESIHTEIASLSEQRTSDRFIAQRANGLESERTDHR
jgi:hypothetical protein